MKKPLTCHGERLIPKRGAYGPNLMIFPLKRTEIEIWYGTPPVGTNVAVVVK